MWSYSIMLVYEFYGLAVEEERRDKAFSAHVARLASYSSRDLSEKGAKTIEQRWTDLQKSLVKGSQEKAKPSSQEGMKKVENRAAGNLFGVAKFKPIKMKDQ